MAARSVRALKKIEKPKPLKVSLARHSSSDIPGQSTVSCVEDILVLLDAIILSIAQKQNTEDVVHFTHVLINKMKMYGQGLEDNYKDQLDKAFGYIRNACKDDGIDIKLRINLLHLIELRAMQWSLCAADNAYYLSNSSIPELAESPDCASSNSANILLGPGEILKSSGKYGAPTKVPGKNYYKDEVVIRNSDSGKVSPGAKERNVQITGPEEEKILLAKQLIEETIKRNASPIREVEKDIGSNSSLNSTASDDSTALSGANHIMGRSLSQSKDDSFEYKHSVVVFNKAIQLSCNDYDCLKWAKLVLEIAIKKKENTSKQTQTSDPPDDRGANVTPTSSEQNTKQQTVAASPNHEINETKNETIRNVSETTKKCMTFKRSPAIKIVQYTRDFLLDLASCNSSCKPPQDWDIICRSLPNIVKPMPAGRDFTLDSLRWQKAVGNSPDTVKQTKQFNHDETTNSDPVLTPQMVLDNEGKTVSSIDSNLVDSE